MFMYITGLDSSEALRGGPASREAASAIIIMGLRITNLE